MVGEITRVQIAFSPQLSFVFRTELPSERERGRVKGADWD